jgi:hypothetical protein
LDAERIKRTTAGTNNCVRRRLQISGSVTSAIPTLEKIPHVPTNSESSANSWQALETVLPGHRFRIT